MAAGFLPSPGKVVNGREIGPCVSPCQHRDCESTRDLAAKLCSECGQPIGYETGFYQDGTWTTLTHQMCSLKVASR